MNFLRLMTSASTLYGASTVASATWFDCEDCCVKFNSYVGRPCEGATGPIGDHACHGDHSCLHSQSVGDLSCLGEQACYHMPWDWRDDTDYLESYDVGEGSCLGNYACMDARGTIGDGSCIGRDSCREAVTDIGDCCLTEHDQDNGSCGVMCTDGCHYDGSDASECPPEVVAGFGNCINGCVAGNNLAIYRDLSLDRCMFLCHRRNQFRGFNECEGVEYFTGDSSHYRAGDCVLSSSDNTDNCPNDTYKVAFYPTSSARSMHKAHIKLYRSTVPVTSNRYFVEPALPQTIDNEECTAPN